MPEVLSIQNQQRTRRWKRTIMFTLLLLAGGAIVNVAVAWGLVLRGTAGRTSQSSLPFFNSEPEIPYWHMELAEGPGWARAFWSGHTISFKNAPGSDWVMKPHERFEIQPPHWSWMEWQTPPRANQWLSWRIDDARGWPVLSMASHLQLELLNSTAPPVWVTTTYGAWLVDQTELQQFVDDAEWRAPMVPFRPVFPGFIINTLFYALLLWLLFFMWFAARRMIRRRRGLCETCAYPIGVSPVCTECGNVVSSSVARASRP